MSSNEEARPIDSPEPTDAERRLDELLRESERRRPDILRRAAEREVHSLQESEARWDVLLSASRGCRFAP